MRQNQEQLEAKYEQKRKAYKELESNHLKQLAEIQKEKAGMTNTLVASACCGMQRIWRLRISTKQINLWRGIIVMDGRWRCNWTSMNLVKGSSQGGPLKWRIKN